jgi:undecaprenyl-diphosphatase
MNRFPTALIVIAALLIPVFVAVFLWIGNQVNTDCPLVQFDNQVGMALEENRLSMPWVRVFFVALTQLGAVESFAILVPLGGVLFWVRRQRVAAITFVVCGLGAGLLNLTTKQYYDRDRPPFKDPLVREANKSYPSGHASGTMANFGLLIYLLTKTKLDRRSRFLMMGLLGLLIVAIDFSRIYLGAHYFSDVTGGIMLGAGWLTFCITAMEVGRWRISTRQ